MVNLLTSYLKQFLMKTKSFTLKTIDGLRLFALELTQEKNIHAVILFVHGFAEHSAMYESWAQRFMDKGYAFLGFDLRGFGRSEGKKGHIDRFQQYLDDVDRMIQYAKEKFPGKPLILYGHSMGGSIAINYALRKSHDLRVVIATSPWLRLSVNVGWLLKILVKIAHRIMPKFSRKAGLDINQLSHDPKVKEAFNKDPLVHQNLTLRTFTQVNKYGKHALDNAGKLDKPMLLMHGSGDKITSHKASRAFASQNNKVHYKEWEGLYHELHNEFEKEEVFVYILRWLEDQIV